MKSFVFLFAIVILFNYCIFNVNAENSFYSISIRRNENDNPYDQSSEEDQRAIDELVNDRMNDIMNIISENKKTYIDEHGKVDENLVELNEVSHLLKRSQILRKKKPVLKFINKNRPQKNLKRELGNNFKEYISYESNIIKHVCPVGNYYVITAYLSDDIVEKVKKLPNVVEVKKTILLEPVNAINGKYYDKEEILKETKWKDLEVQEEEINVRLVGTHLSMISQGQYKDTSKNYDNNYYYPATAGKGIDVYVIDDGMNGLIDEEAMEDFDTYENDPENKRTIKCLGEFSAGEISEPHNVTQCEPGEISGTYTHGCIVSRIIAGKKTGVAKKANLYMLAIDMQNISILAALDHILQVATPHKSVVNMSIGCRDDDHCMDDDLQNKILELKEKGVIIIVASGNSTKDRCWSNMFHGAKGVIAVGAVNDGTQYDYYSMEDSYTYASYSNYGNCTVIFAPGTYRSPLIYRSLGRKGMEGTSFASPMVAGTVATIMGEDSETEYDFESMRDKIIELSVKDVIKGLPEGTPNRLLNNGKKSIYGHTIRCDDPSGEYSCGEDACCSHGICVKRNQSYRNVTYGEEYCLIENGCQREFGHCDTNYCGARSYNKERKCLEGECCSKEGECVKIQEDVDELESKKLCFVENGCQSEFSDACLTYDLNEIQKYDEKQQMLIKTSICQKDITDILGYCDFIHKFIKEKKAINDPDERNKICEKYDEKTCKEFFENPISFSQNCKDIDYKYDFGQEYMSDTLYATERLYCSKDNEENYCLKDAEIFIDDNVLMAHDVKQYCKDIRCHEDMYSFLGNYYIEMAFYYRLYRLYGSLQYEAIAYALKDMTNTLLHSEECSAHNITEIPNTYALPDREPKEEKSTSIQEEIPTNSEEPSPTSKESGSKPTSKDSDASPTTKKSESKPTSKEEPNVTSNAPAKTDSSSPTSNNGNTGKDKSDSNKSDDKSSSAISRLSNISLALILIIMTSSLLLL